MRTEATQRVPSPRTEVYDYLIDPKTWTYWMAGVIDVRDSDQANWEQPGDQIDMGYRLLGRRIEAQVELDEIRPAQYVRCHVTSSAGGVNQQWFYSDIGEGSTSLRVVYDTDEPTSFFGKIIGHTVVPTVIERDLRATLSNLEQIFALGVLD